MAKRLKHPPRLDFMEQSISGAPVTTKEQRRVVDAIKRRLAQIKRRIFK